ncbi:MAG TPA: 2OG-Fe(II) oxygenase [Rhizomicrobium sp.]|nr:2OG-Fe(II) oxygenase [Rhizomicrobium sp.]
MSSAHRLKVEPVAGPNWPAIANDLNAFGCATIRSLLPAQACCELAMMYDDDARFRSRVIMARHGFGRGEYKYLAYPLPALIAELRTELYPPLAKIANDWNASLKSDIRFPPTHSGYLERCHDAGQTRPTPLLLKYGEGDYNCLHQDLYGELVFPLQVAVLLSAGDEFTGGEFVLVEQRPRMQSRAEIVPLAQGDGVVFPVHHRPVRGSRGVYRVTMRHGVSRIRSGSRQTLGIIFHDAL